MGFVEELIDMTDGTDLGQVSISTKQGKYLSS